MEKLYHNRDWLYEQYIVNNRTIKSICSEFGVSHQTIEKFLKKFNLQKKPKAERIPTPEEIRELYENQGQGIQSIICLYPGVGTRTILRIMRENNIDIISPGKLHSKWWAKEENKAVMSEKRRALWQDEEYRNKTYEHLKDKEAIMDRAIKQSARYQGVPVEEWTGFLTPEQSRIRNSEEYASWRKKVFERDNYTCQCCGDRSYAGHPVNLHAHHLENFAHNEALRFNVDNGITLCYNCHDIRAHGSFHNLYGIHRNTKEQFEEYLRLRKNKDIDEEEEIGRYFADGEVVGAKQKGIEEL